MPKIDLYPVTGDNAKAFRALNKYGMNLADFAGLTTSSTYDRIGKGGTYTVSNWISDGVFANLAAAPAVYPIIQDGNDQVDWVLLQSAVDFMIYGSLGSTNFGSTKRTLYIPAGVFYLNRPLQIGYGRVGTPPAALNGNGYVSITIEGEGPHYNPDGNGMTGTTLDFSSYTNDVCIAVNLNVQTFIKKLTVKGGYTYNNSFSALNTAAVSDRATWKDPALPSVNWYEGAAVHVGIAIDPYSDSGSAAAYPARVLPSYFGGGTSTAGLGSAGSSHVTIEDVDITQCVVGLGRVHGDGNGEFIEMVRGRFYSCVFAFVNCHSQSRNVSIRDTDFFNFHTAISNRGGTRSNANMHGCYDNIHASYGYQIVNVDSAGWTGPLTFRNLYSEGIVRFGIGHHLQLDNCYFSAWDAGGVGTSPKYHFEGVDTLLLTNTLFASRGGIFVKGQRDGATKITINNSRVSTFGASNLTGNANALLAQTYTNGIYGAMGPRSRKFVGVESGQSSGYGGSVGQTPEIYTHAAQETTTYSANAEDIMYGTWGSDTLLGSEQTFRVPKIGAAWINIGTCASRSGFDLTFTRYNFGTLKADVGDIFYIGQNGDENLVCVVTSISGGNMVLRQQNSFWSPDAATYQTDGNTQVTGGDTNVYARYVCTRILRNPYLVMGSVTDGSEIITNVKSAHDTGNAVSTTELEMAVGDLYIHPEIEMLNAGGSPVSPLNPVTAIDTGAQTITLTNDFNVTNPHYPVVFYVKVFNA